WDLQEALSPDRCAVCFVAERSVDRFLQTLSYESTNDPELRQRFVDGGGFCQRHGWRFVELTHDALGLALLYRHLLGVAVRQGFLRVGEHCVACIQEARAERDLARILPDELQRPEFRTAAFGAAFCERHAPPGHPGPRLGASAPPPAPRKAAGCPDCAAELGWAIEGDRRCLRHVRSWQEETGWLPVFLELLDEYVGLQDYRRVGEDEGRARGAAWLALYWTVGASDQRVVNDLLPRLGIRSQLAVMSLSDPARSSSWQEVNE
ncbi:MAG: hypothetical protein JO247_19200, partial [Chloroflexi bacterium]|nr:hypothetical protein [Chloroflexota bacterium]